MRFSSPATALYRWKRNPARLGCTLDFMAFDIKQLVQTRLGENYLLHERHLNSTLVAVQRIIGFEQVYGRAGGAYLYDREGHSYLDFRSGYSVFNIGRNHPTVKQA